MQLINQEDYTLVQVGKTSKLDRLIDFLNTSSSNPTHLIIDFSNTVITDNTIFNQLLPFHFNWAKNHKSFILISI